MRFLRLRMLYFSPRPSSLESFAVTTDETAGLLWIRIKTLLLLLLQALAAVLTTSQVAFGTLVVTVPTRNGLVICADKRKWNKVQGGIDDDTKVFQIGRNAAFAIAGHRSILSEKDYAVLFDVADAPMVFFRQHPAERIEGLWDNLQEAIVGAYRVHLERGGPPFTTEYLPPDRTLFLAMFYYVIGGEIRVKKIRATYSEVPQPAISTRLEDHSKVAIHLAQVEGQGEVVAELREGTNPNFNAMRSDALFQRLTRGVQPSELSSAEGLQAARRIIEATSRLRHLLSAPGPTMVSPSCDCGVLSPQNGFAWSR